MDISNSKQRSLPITTSQKQLLTDYISERPEMYIGRLTPNYTREKMKKNWCEITLILNSIPNGPAKEWTQWRKTWVDMKKHIKSKFVKERNHARGTGGGPPLPPSTEDTSVDRQILQIIPMVTIEGDEKIEESEVSFLEDDALLYGAQDSAAKQFVLTEHQYCSTVAAQNTAPTFSYTGTSSKTAPTFPHTDVTSSMTTPTILHDISSSKTAITLPTELLQTEESSSKTKTSRTPIQRKVRGNKSKRLEESLKTNNRFIELNAKKFKNDEMYQNKKISLLERRLRNQELYENRVASALEKIAESLARIASANSD